MRTFIIILGLFSGFISLPSLASSPTWYRIEVMLVAFHSTHLIGDESWPQELSFPTPMSPSYQQWLKEHPVEVKQLFSRLNVPHTTNPASVPLRLTEGVERISKRTDVEILSHKAWLEPIQNRTDALYHPIKLNFIRQQYAYQLQGNISFHVERYLHTNTNLVLRKSMIMNELDRLDPNTDAIEIELLDLEPVQAANIRLNRRMRSNELHYLDHPFLGLLVKATPVRTAEDI